MSDLIHRCELFNKLATIPAPAEANEYKAAVYAAINEMDAVELNGLATHGVDSPCEVERAELFFCVRLVVNISPGKLLQEIIARNGTHDAIARQKGAAERQLVVANPQGIVLIILMIGIAGHHALTPLIVLPRGIGH